MKSTARAPGSLTRTPDRSLGRRSACRTVAQPAGFVHEARNHARTRRDALRSRALNERAVVITNIPCRLVFVGLLKQLRSCVRNALPVVTWPSRLGPDATPVPQATAPPLAPPADPASAAIVPEDALAQAIAHLEYLGYEIGLDPDGWSHARHPYRYDFHLRAFALGIRLHCAVEIGASLGSSRAAWLDFLNDANERGLVTRFSLCEDEAGVYRIRMRALVSGAYNRSVFAMVMDMWHDDLDLVRRKPAFLTEGSAGEGEDAAAVTVNLTLH
jgi:hypothetical protein